MEAITTKATTPKAPTPKAIAPVYDLYAESLPPGVLAKLCQKVRSESKICADKKTFMLENVCAGGEVMPLANMERIYLVVYVLQLVLEEKKE